MVRHKVCAQAWPHRAGIAPVHNLRHLRTARPSGVYNILICDQFQYHTTSWLSLQQSYQFPNPRGKRRICNNVVPMSWNDGKHFHLQIYTVPGAKQFHVLFFPLASPRYHCARQWQMIHQSHSKEISDL